MRLAPASELASQRNRCGHVTPGPSLLVPGGHVTPGPGMAPAEYSWGGVQIGAKHQEDPHTAPKALRQGSGGAAPSGGPGGGAPFLRGV